MKEKVMFKIRLVGEKSQIIRYVIYFLIVMLAGLAKITSRSDPYMVPDEMGYWAAAAWMNGIDWNAVMSNSGYYGFGYGIVLSILFLIKNSQLRFWCAEIINVLFLYMGFVVLCSITKKLEKTLKRNLLEVICLTATLYSYHIAFAHITQSEIFLTFLYLLSVRLLIWYFERENWKRILPVTVVIVCMLGTHLRCIVFPIALLGAMVYKNGFEIKKYRNFIIFIVVLAAGFCIISEVKSLLIEYQYISAVEGTYHNHNDSIAEKASVFLQIFDFNFWKNLLRTVGGRVFYLGCSSFFLFYWGTWYLIGKIVKSIRIRQKGQLEAVLVYLILSVCGGIGISALTMLQAHRIDQVIYGRYVENILALFLVFGLIALVRSKITYKIFCLCTIFQLGMAIVFYKYIISKELTATMDMQICGIAGLFHPENMPDAIFYSVYAAIITAIIAVFILICSRMKRLYLIFGTLSVVWVLTAYNVLEKNVYNDAIRYDRIRQVSQKLVKNDQGKQYYVIPGDDIRESSSAYFDMYNLQYDMGAKSLAVISENEMQQIKKGNLIILHKRLENVDKLKVNYHIVWENDLMYLLEAER